MLLSKCLPNQASQRGYLPFPLLSSSLLFHQLMSLFTFDDVKRTCFQTLNDSLDQCSLGKQTAAVQLQLISLLNTYESHFTILIATLKQHPTNMFGPKESRKHKNQEKILQCIFYNSADEEPSTTERSQNM